MVLALRRHGRDMEGSLFVGGGGGSARLGDSASHLAMGIAKPQLLPLHTQSLLSSLPCSLGSTGWSILISHAALLWASKGHDLAEECPFPLFVEASLAV